MGSSKVYLISFFLDFRASSAGVSRRIWFTHVIEIRTVLSIKLPEIVASTADYRSALKWECPKNVSCLQKQYIVCHTLSIRAYMCCRTLSICDSHKGRKILCNYTIEANVYIHMHGKEFELCTQRTLLTSELSTLQPKCCHFRTNRASCCFCNVTKLCGCENFLSGSFHLVKQKKKKTTDACFKFGLSTLYSRNHSLEHRGNSAGFLSSVSVFPQP